MLKEPNEVLNTPLELVAADYINALARDIGQWAKAKGFWNMPEQVQELYDRAMRDGHHDTIAFLDLMRKAQKGYLMMSELGEHCESLRTIAKDVETDGNGPPGGNECEELADTIIRILDYCGQYQLPIGECIMFKMAKNQKRPYQHGKKF